MRSENIRIEALDCEPNCESVCELENKPICEPNCGLYSEPNCESNSKFSSEPNSKLDCDPESELDRKSDSRKSDLESALEIWNSVVLAGRAFPQTDAMDVEEARRFFGSQSRTAVAKIEDKVVGMYILHPNNVGRCSHIANASYAVAEDLRGCGIGRALVEDSIAQAGKLGFTGLQFNAVVASNVGAIGLYESIGFTRIGTIPGGYLNINGEHEDIFIYFIPTPNNQPTPAQDDSNLKA